MIFKKAILLILLTLSINTCFLQSNEKLERLKISANGHFLQYEDGRPFFWLGDTGWYLFSRLKKEDIGMYFENRRHKGFNVIQAAVLRDDLTRPNQYGDIPFEQLDPEKPKAHFFELVDWTVQKALDKNMFIGLLPTWGDNVSNVSNTGSIQFNEKNAYTYGLFLGKRYENYPNIIWIAGGDKPPYTEKADWRPIWRAMIKGLREGSNGKALITYHPWGERSSTDFWKDEDKGLLDLNMLQSGHARHDVPVWEWIVRDYHMLPARPILDGEINYEDHPVNWKPELGYFRDYDVRKQMYRSVFSGACGVTYGHQAIRQFYNPLVKPMGFPDRFWTEALDRPGAYQAGYLKKLMESRPLLTRVPDQTIINDGQGEKGEYVTAFRDSDNSYAMIYLPVGKKIEVNVSWMKTKKISAWWFNPRTAETQKIGAFKKKDRLKFLPPTTGVTNDWVLVLDDAEKRKSAPATNNTYP